MNNVLTAADIHKAVQILKGNSRIEDGQLVWIDNEHFYQSPLADVYGFRCTKEEIEAAKLREDGFIKTAHGVALYLTRNLPANTEEK
jgi:hypothetical protein